MSLFLFIAVYLSLVFSYLAYKTEHFNFAWILLLIAGLNLIALSILWLDGSNNNF